MIARPQLLKYPSLDDRGEGATEKNLIHGVFVDGALVCPRKKCSSDQTYGTGDAEEEGFFSKLKKRIFGSSDAR